MTTSNPPPDTAVYGRRASDRASNRNQWFMIIVLSLAVIFVVYQQVDAKLGENEAKGTAQELGQVVDEQCQDVVARREIGTEQCDRAAEVVSESTIILAPEQGEDGKPGRDGKNGNDGKAGRGITNTAVVDGHLYVTYTDGVREDKGMIAVNGQNGRGISGAALQNESLVLTYTDGTSAAVGRIVGRDGERGRGIDDVVVSADYRVIVTYTDGTIEDVGALPPGPAGAVGPTGPAGVPGRGVQTIDFDLQTCQAKVYYTDGFVETKDMTGCSPDEPPTTTTTIDEPPPPG